MKRVFLAILLTVTTANAGDVGAHLWSKVLGSTTLNSVTQLAKLAVDSSGNIFITGRFSGTADFGAGPVASGGGGAYDVFVAKYTPAGAYSWMKHVNTGQSVNSMSSIAVDSNGDVIAVGLIFSTGSIDFGSPCTPFTTTGRDTVIVKYSNAGACVWARNITSTDADSGVAVAVDSSDNVFVGGGYKGTLTFGGGITLTAHTGANSTTDIYLAKFDSSGTALWAKGFGQNPDVVVSQNDYQKVYDLATTASGDVVMVGTFRRTVDFCYPGTPCPMTTADNAVSGPSRDGFIAKYNSSGVAQWAKQVGESGGGDQVAYGVAIDSAGNIITVGHTEGPADFGTAPKATIGSMDMYVYKINPSGQAIWARRYGAPGWTQHTFEVAIDAFDNIVAVGDGSGDVNYGTGPVVFPSGYASNLVILKLTSSGTYVWSKYVGDQWFQFGYGVATDASSNVIVGGIIDGTMDLGGGQLASLGASTDSFFLGKFRP